MPEEEYVAIMDVFNEFDKNNDGSIGPNELHSVMQSLGQKLNQTETKVLMSMADTNQNGMINFAEFFKVLAKWDAWMVERQGDKPTKDKSAEFKEAVEKFKLFDQNGNGTIDATELSSVLQSMGKEVTSTQIKYLMNLADVDENGAIRFSEFFKALKKLRRDQAQQDYGHLDDKEIRALFRTFDVDGTGFISSCELRKMAVAFDMKPSDQEVRVALNQLDVNGNGQIDYEEFITLMKLK